MNHLLFHRTTRPTGRRLAQALGIDGSVEVPPGVVDVLIRWGNARYEHEDNRVGKVLNTCRSIIRAGDKLGTFRTLREAGIRVPDFYPTWGWETVAGRIMLGRSRRGFGGRDIEVIPADGRPQVQHEFYSTYIPNTREYRIHVVKDNVIRVQRKYLEHPDQQRNPHIKNHANGYVFKAPQRSLRRSRYMAAIDAVRALDLTFGAVDLVIDDEGLEYVLEVNTAPACSPLTMSKYAEALRREF